MRLLATAHTSRPWRIHETLITVILVCAGLATFTLPPGQQHTSTNWAAAASGWLLPAIASSTRPAVLVSLLVAPLAAALTIRTTVAGTSCLVELSCPL